MRAWLQRELPWLVTTAALALALLVVRPWGDFALNDDWTYAHLAKHIAATNQVVIDVPIAPNAVGQALLGAAVVKVFGFSHTVLRVLTIVLSVLALWAIDRMLKRTNANPMVRLATLLTLAFSPLYFYSTTTFMNELHGWLPALFGVGLWFWDRARLAAHPDRVITWWVCWVVALICGFSFWTRQFAVLLFPAVLAATASGFALERKWRPIVRALPIVGVGLALCLGSVYGFFVWAKATGNYRPEFAVRIDNLLKLTGKTWAMQGGAVVAYMTLYFLPFLALTSWSVGGQGLRGALKKRWPLVLGALGVVALGLNTKRLFLENGVHDFWVGPIWHHKVFPFIVNIVSNAALGPVTTDDAFFFQAPVAAWPKWVWQAVEVVLLVACVQWSPLVSRAARLIKEAPTRVGAETALFGAFLAVGCVPAIIQAHQQEMVDRYHLPILLGLMFIVPAAAFHGGVELKSTRAGVFALALTPLVLFSVLGAHDEFRWNEARHDLVLKAYASGGTRATVQAGWEYNCFERHEGLTAQDLVCQPRCFCAYNGFCCVDDTWRVGVSLSPGYTEVARLQPSYWLAPGPPLILSRRPSS